MRIGVPKEIQAQEQRVALTPAGVRRLSGAGNPVLVERGAGAGSGFADDEYIGAGAEIVPTAEELWGRAELVWKVEAPLPSECAYLRAGQLLFCFLHLAADRALTLSLLKSGVIAFSCETVQKNGRLPLLAPMSEVAGRLAVQAGARCLELHNGGRGVLLGGVPGVAPARVAVLGGGVAGRNAATLAAGMGADVTVLDLDADVLRHLEELDRGRIKTLFSSAETLETALSDADLLIGALLLPGARCPRLVSRAHLSLMKPGAVLVDLAIDQGGVAETSRPTTHAEPAYIVDGIVHFAVPNLPGAVPRTSTPALANASLPYGLVLAGLGWKAAITADPGLRQGLALAEGRLCSAAVAEAHGLPMMEP